MRLLDDRHSDGWGGGRLRTNGSSHLAPAEALEQRLFGCGGAPFWHTGASTLCHRAAVFLPRVVYRSEEFDRFLLRSAN